MLAKLENIQVYEKRFGQIAVEKGYISSDVVVRVLKIQVEEESFYGGHRLFGQILQDEGILTACQVEDVLQALFEANGTLNGEPL